MKQTLNRFEWFKAVLQVEGLSATAKNIAGALAIQFANAETGQINPSNETLADYLKVHRDTVKRGLRELRNAGWLLTLGAGGRGKSSMMRLVSPSKIIPFRRAKGVQNNTQNTSERGANLHPNTEKRGANLPQKGCKSAPPLYKEEQYKEQKGCAPIRVRWNKHRFTGNPWDGLKPIPSTNIEALAQWGRWLECHDLPSLHDIPLRVTSEHGKKYFLLPWLTPPSDASRADEAKEYIDDLIRHQAALSAASVAQCAENGQCNDHPVNRNHPQQANEQDHEQDSTTRSVAV